MSSEFPKTNIEKEKGFYPGELSQTGFLAASENINDVVLRDRAICERHGVTPREIGEAVENVLEGRQAEKFEVTTKVWRGIQKCPFDKKYDKYGSMDFTITNKATGNSFNGPGLIVHLLKEHDFFEGNTPYRVEPEAAIQVLFEK